MKQCDELLIPAMSALLNKMGIVKTVNRNIVHSPYQYGGLNIPNLYIRTHTKDGYNRSPNYYSSCNNATRNRDIKTHTIPTV